MEAALSDEDRPKEGADVDLIELLVMASYQVHPEFGA